MVLTRGGVASRRYWQYQDISLIVKAGMGVVLISNSQRSGMLFKII